VLIEQIIKYYFFSGMQIHISEKEDRNIVSRPDTVEKCPLSNQGDGNT